MEQSRSISVGLVVGLPLIAIGLVTGLSYLLTASRKADRPSSTVTSESEERPDPAPIRPAQPPIEPAPRARVATVGAPPKAPAAPAKAPAAPPVLSTARPGLDPRAAAALQEPAVRQHAQLVFVENARHAMTQRNLERLRQLRDVLRYGELAQTIAPADLQAIDVGLDCLVQAGGFHQRADDFLADNPSSGLAESLRGICQ